MGVARPGIAPLRPGVQKTPVTDDPPPSYRPLQELGATQNPMPRVRGEHLAAGAPASKQELRNTHPLGRRRFDKRMDLRKPQPIPRQAVRGARSKRPVLVVGAALVLVVGAIAAVLLWPSAPPLKAQVRSGDGGAEVLDVTCESCPDGTLISVRDVTAKVSGARATLPLESPLAVGDNALRVTIDRPSAGRDEVVSLPVRVAYRIRPDLTTLEADRPSLQIIIEAMEGATVELDGEDVPLRDGRAIKSVDVTKDVTGSSSDAGSQLSRRINFLVKPPDGPEEKGVVAVSVAVLPLAIVAPGRAIVTDKQTFTLAGRTSPGAEILVAGRSLGVTKDGTFQQTMNVSSVGSTEIEVRAKMPGRAPRLVRVAVERVTSLESAAEQFTKKSPLAYSEVARDISAARDKPVALTGEVVESRVQDGVTTLIIRAESPGCSDGKCIARLIQGRNDLGADRGAKIRAYGTVAGEITHDGTTIPDIDVAFAIVDSVVESAVKGAAPPPTPGLAPAGAAPAPAPAVPPSPPPTAGVWQ